MILETLASLVILAVTAGPGRWFERRVDQRAPRHFRSSFAEYVELVITGAVTTLVAVLVVALLAGVLSIIDLGEILSHPKAALKAEPHQIVISVMVAFGLSFLLADLAARALYPKPKATGQNTYTQHTAWYEAFEEDRPDDHAVSVSIELTDGIQIVGFLRRYTPTESDDRELRVEDVIVRRPGQSLYEEPPGSFLLLRESQVKYMVGEYAAGADRRGS